MIESDCYLESMAKNILSKKNKKGIFQKKTQNERSIEVIKALVLKKD
ncbi:hypothetical protein GCM10011482_00010 [Enterococcus alcedinis]|uniref:Uncharacterized protein n=1 Tax=Enterococcus alcedinis TaxID=1274384 RepID=A0A917JE05_9ENTE|nr:hypothetical protein GCM10011482_00010 [Enterococcus alcedinis]